MRIATLKTLQRGLLITTAAGLTTMAGQVYAQQSQNQNTYSGNSSQTSGSQSSGSEKVSSSASRFIKEAVRGNDMEIGMGEIGARKAQNPELKAFCEQLQQDHTKANDQLKPMAQKYGITLEQSQGRHHERELTSLDKEQAGAKWDQKFATEMLKDHQKDIAKYERAASDIQESDLKQYVQQTLPVLQQHFQRAETVAKAVGVSDSTISSYAKKLPASVGGTSSDQNFKSDQGSGAKDLNKDNLNSSGSSVNR